MAANTRRGPEATGTPSLDTILQALRRDDALVILRLPDRATRPRLDSFLADFCPRWADLASEMLWRTR